MEKIRLECGQGTAEEALEVVVGITTALRLLVAELVALTVGGTVEALRKRAPLLWNAKSLIDQASAVHEILLEFWPELSRMCQELRSAIAAYEDASTNASARLMTAAGTTRALNLLPPEMGSVTPGLGSGSAAAETTVEDLRVTGAAAYNIWRGWPLPWLSRGPDT
ncbi:hypothetical protein ACIQZO_39095 [Streptomyces sp. NPDC097617]|uniref:hypothetical protein n=1 Tax=Streptomyces sp. NPDC097617 TaxID=3366091 RepID=UPI003809CF7F